MNILLPKVDIVVVGGGGVVVNVVFVHHLICSLLGPGHNSVSNFIRMIWEYKLSTVVMLTKCIEGGKVNFQFQFMPYTKHIILEIYHICRSALIIQHLKCV